MKTAKRADQSLKSFKPLNQAIVAKQIRPVTRLRLGWIISLFLVAALLCLNPGVAKAAVSLSVQPGLSGMYKVERPVILSIEIENTGPEFAGVVEVKPFDETAYGYRANQAELDRANKSQDFLNKFPAYKTEVLIPADSKKALQMVIPGNLAGSLPVVELSSNGVRLAQSRVEGAAVHNRVVLALSEAIMSSGLQTWAAEGNGALTLKYFPSKSVPPEAGDLRVADLILVDAASAAELTNSQVRALNDWVHLGGWLVLFGSAAGVEGELFADLSPVKVTGSKQIVSNLGGLHAGKPVTVATGDLAAGKALLTEEGALVLASRALGQGQVLYCGIAPEHLGKEAVVFWSILTGYATEIQVGEGRVLIPGQELISKDYGNSLVEASSYISQLKGPAEELLFGLWLLYIAAIGPLLYLILRRLDRRDWAWGLIPAGALLATLGFYLLAPSHRIPGQLYQTLAAIDVLNPHLAEIQAGATLVSARGGDLSVQGAEGMYLLPVTTQGGVNADKGVVYQGADNSRVEFFDVEFGSLRQVQASGIIRNLGSIEGRLSLTGAKIQGQLVNKTGFDLRDAQLVFDGKLITIGDFAVNETKTIEEMVSTWETTERSREIFPATGAWGGDDPYARERRMLNGPVGVSTSRTGIDMIRAETIAKDGSSRVESGWPEQVQFIGWCDGTPKVLAVTGSGRETQACGLILLKQELPMELLPGEVRLPAGMIKPLAAKIKGINYSTQGIELYENVGYLSYDLANLGGMRPFEVTGLEFPGFLITPSYGLEIRNQSAAQWEPITSEGLKLGSADLGHYLTPEQILEVRLVKRSAYTEFVPISLGPAVEGVVAE